jgi:hypothetical protein
LAILGLELRTLCLQSSTLLLEPCHQPLWCGSVKGTACAPAGRDTYPHNCRCH